MDRQFFAQIDDNNIVTDVHCVTQEFLDANPDRYPGTWVETFYDDPNKTYAGIGFIYNDNTQNFVAPEEPIDDDNEQ